MKEKTHAEAITSTARVGNDKHFIKAMRIIRIITITQMILSIAILHDNPAPAICITLLMYLIYCLSFLVEEVCLYLGDKLNQIILELKKANEIPPLDDENV